MEISWKMYVGFGAIAVSAFLAGKWVSIHWIEDLAAIPVFAALTGAAFQLIRDQQKYQDSIALQRDQQHFMIGVSSHMANVAFDKHVEFCEKYITHLQKGLTEMWARDPSPECVKLASELADIRLSYRAWVVFDLNDKIMNFEQALRQVGGTAILLKDVGVGEERTRKVDEMYETFEKLLDLRHDGKVRDEQLAPGRIMDYLQEMLGTKELAQLRACMVKNAIRALEKSSL
jgi:hypothetical protein